MKQKLIFFLLIGLIFAVLISCKSGKQSETDTFSFEDIYLDEDRKVIYNSDTVGLGLPIFYNMYLSVEMSTLFESIGAVFNSDLLNPTIKIPEYITSSKKALNLGIYAVDLSYARIFEQLEFTSKYFHAMQRLSEELGIPSDYFLTTAKRFDRNINNKDSLIEIANEVYVATDNYLKENERYNAAAQIILGGWTEALYIAMDMAKVSNNIEVLERIAEQKYSLENLIEMLNAHSDDEVITHYLVKLEKLQKIFDSYEANVNSSINDKSLDEKDQLEYIISEIAELEKHIKELRGEITG
jgi:hypothetical protein